MAVTSTVLSNYFITRKDKKIDDKETAIQKNMDEVDTFRDYEERAKSLLNHYEELMAVAQVQSLIKGEIERDSGVIATARHSFLQGMAWRYSAAIDENIGKDLPVWKELFERSISGDNGATVEMTEAREELLKKYSKRNNDLIKDARKLQAEKRLLERSVDSINRWNLAFLVIGILITLLRDLFG